MTGFTKKLPQILGAKEYPMDFWVAFNMIAYTLFLVGGIIIYQNRKQWMVIPLFFILFGIIFNSIGHILISLYVGGYFPGLYSVFPYIVIGPILINRILKESAIQ